MSWERQNGPIVRTGYNAPDAFGNVVSAALLHRGAVPSARLVQTTKPTANDTATIGGKQFKFVSSLSGASGSFTQVKLLSTAALTLASFVNAINGVADSNVVQSTAPLTAAIVADIVSSTILRIRLADKRGGNPICGVSPSITLAKSMTAGGNIWNCANLNASGKLGSDSQCSFSNTTIDSTMVTNGSFQLELPFTPTVVFAFVNSSAGVQRASTDAVTISGNAVNIALAGGASPAIQATDIVTVLAIE